MATVYLIINITLKHSIVILFEGFRELLTGINKCRIIVAILTFSLKFNFYCGGFYIKTLNMLFYRDVSYIGTQICHQHNSVSRINVSY